MAQLDFTPAFHGHPVPPMLDDLAKFADNVSDGYFSGRFKLAPDDATEWIAEAGNPSDFAIFGHDPDGSMYAFWLYDDHTPETAPIVYLQAGHGGSVAIANSLGEFLSLLALDIADIGVYFDEGDRPRIASTGHTRFVKWLAKRFEITPAPVAERVVKRAGAAHPKLSARYGKRGN
jgi:hypothetical protein